MDQNTVIILVVLAMVMLYLWYRQSKRPPAKYHLTYADYSEDAANPSDNLADAFGDMIPARPKGLTLYRVSLFNRGDANLAADEFLSPFHLCFPETSRILNAQLSDIRGRVQADDVKISVNNNCLTVAPLALGYRSSILLNLVIDGQPGPVSVSGSLKNQEWIEPIK